MLLELGGFGCFILVGFLEFLVQLNLVIRLVYFSLYNNPQIDFFLVVFFFLFSKFISSCIHFVITRLQLILSDESFASNFLNFNSV